MPSKTTISSGELSLCASSFTGTFATRSIGSAKVKTALNSPWKASSGSRAMLNRL